MKSKYKYNLSNKKQKVLAATPNRQLIGISCSLCPFLKPTEASTFKDVCIQIILKNKKKPFYNIKFLFETKFRMILRISHFFADTKNHFLLNDLEFLIIIFTS